MAHPNINQPKTSTHYLDKYIHLFSRDELRHAKVYEISVLKDGSRR